jgi:hypothetical protein
VGGVNFFHTERYFLTIDLSKRLRATSRSRGVCFGVGRFETTGKCKTQTGQ